MTWFKSFVKWFSIAFVVAWLASYALTIVIAPVVACSFAVVYAACQSGNTLYLFISVWIIPTFMAIVFGFYAIKYHEMKDELAARKEAEAEEIDADR